MADSRSRRQFVRAAALGVGLLVAPSLLAGCASSNESIMDGPAAASAWDRVPEILARIRPPQFPDRDFMITDYGAVEGGEVMATEAFREAVAACHGADGAVLASARQGAEEAPLFAVRDGAWTSRVTDLGPAAFASEDLSRRPTIGLIREDRRGRRFGTYGSRLARCG